MIVEQTEQAYLEYQEKEAAHRKELEGKGPEGTEPRLVEMDELDYYDSIGYSDLSLPRNYFDNRKQNFFDTYGFIEDKLNQDGLRAKL